MNNMHMDLAAQQQQVKNLKDNLSVAHVHLEARKVHINLFEAINQKLIWDWMTIYKDPNIFTSNKQCGWMRRNYVFRRQITWPPNSRSHSRCRKLCSRPLDSEEKQIFWTKRIWCA
jgi:hypothetical protein